MATFQTIIGGTSDAPATTGVVEYTALIGEDLLPWTATESYVYAIISTPGKLTNFKMAVGVAPGSGNSWAFTIRKGSIGGAMADTALSVSIADTAVISSLDISEVTVAAGDRVTISAVGTSSPTAAGAVYWRCDFIPDTAG